jgi:hypothetical protein
MIPLGRTIYSGAAAPVLHRLAIQLGPCLRLGASLVYSVVLILYSMAGKNAKKDNNGIFLDVVDE